MLDNSRNCHYERRVLARGICFCFGAKKQIPRCARDDNYAAVMPSQSRLDFARIGGIIGGDISCGRRMTQCPISKVPCEERDCLDSAYQQALEAKYDLESQLGQQLSSPNPHIAKRARKQLEKASKHTSHLLSEWLTHWKNHGCR